MISALGMNPALSLQPNANRLNQTSVTSTNDFGEVLNSAMRNNDVVSRLRSLGVPVNIMDTPKKSKSIGSNGVTIAPNIIRRMEQDEDYAQEIIDKVYDFLDYASECKQMYALQGAKLKWIGMSIDSDGKVVMWAGAGKDEDSQDNDKDDELLEIVVRKEMTINPPVNQKPFSSSHNANVDASDFFALVGNVNHKSQRRDD